VIPTRAFDVQALRIALRAALLANPTISGIVGATGVYADVDAIGNPAIYVIITVPSVVILPYPSDTKARVQCDLTCVAVGYASDAETVKFAMQQVMLDGTLVVPAYTVNDVKQKQTRDRALMQEERVYFYRGDCYEVWLTKN
jgi:hypothetical protein